ASYKKRTENKSEFIYFNKKYAYGEKNSKLDSLSLNLKKRKTQKKKDAASELSIENNYLISKNIKPVKDMSALKDIEALNQDFLLDETQKIASEFIEICEEKGFTW
ncbi:MAG: hypothetical protein GY702_26600, partial [Desulfobulbaceae bacterium]|nr:hypothetical protein [Desulfobulbaceae bacterium]